jgi:hypothetical protein
MLDKILDLDHTWDIGTRPPVEPVILTVHLRDAQALFSVVGLNIVLLHRVARLGQLQNHTTTISNLARRISIFNMQFAVLMRVPRIAYEE